MDAASFNLLHDYLDSAGKIASIPEKLRIKIIMIAVEL